MSYWVCFLCLLITVLPAKSAVAADDIWRITSLNWEPYAGKHLPEQGDAIQTLRRLLKPHGIRLEVDFYPWRRAQKQAQETKYIGYFPAWPEEVNKGFVASGAIGYSRLAVIQRTGERLDAASLETLFQKQTVGLIKTYRYPSAITQLIQRYPEQVMWADSEKTLLRKLSAGRHKTAITDVRVMQFHKRQEQLSNIRVQSLLKQVPLVLALRDGADNQANIRLLRKILNQQNRAALQP